MIRPWPRLDSQPVFDAGLFSVTRDRTRSPRTGHERDVYVLHMVDWLMTVPLTEQGELVMVRQYRHGSGEASLEIPGGLHDGAGERHEAGAARELAEETGYGGGVLSFLGELRPQPALMSNRVRIYLARGVRRMASAQPDAGEDIEVVLLDPSEIAARIASGEMNNAMTVTALALARFGGQL
ncbi:MAG: NUDIX hydrolase [Betaproteobacteria bacterium]|nr:MAG: NUDIX hydrolase [Betaproteobacteria bacterium]